MRQNAVYSLGLLALPFAIVAATSFAFADEPKNDFARWEKSIAAFEEQDRKQPPPENAFLFAGSSSIRLWKLSTDFPDLRTINRGFGGSEIADSNHFADRIIIKPQPHTIVLYAGDNDISRGKSAKQVARDFRQFVKTIRAKLPRTRILFLAIKPSIRRWNLAETMQAANQQIQEICNDDELLAYVDIWKPMLGDDGRPRAELFAKDGLHLNREGYKLWAGVLKPHLKAD